MRILHTAAFVLAIVLTLVGSAQPSAAMVLYPWCVQGNDSSNCATWKIRMGPLGEFLRTCRVNAKSQL